jgi:Tfp pilus assembly protein PilO
MKPKNVAVGILAAVLTTALWYTFLLKPTRSEASKVKVDTAAERAKLQPLQAELAKAKRDAAHAASFKAQLASLQLAMPDSPALAAFIRDANGIADASGVAWQSVSHAAPAPGTAGVMAIAVGITVKGTYPQVMDYLGRLAELQRLVVVDNVQFNVAAAASAGGAGGGAGAPGGAGAGGDSSGGSTGPFSGGSSLTATIAARMFETPSAVSTLAGTAASGTGTAATGATPATPASGTSTLNNS